MITPSQDDSSERKWEHMPQNVSGDHLWMERWWEILIFSFSLVSKSSKNQQCITSVKKRSVIIITNAPKRFHSWGKRFIWKPPRVGAGEASPSACVKMWALTAVCVAPSKLLQGTQGGTKRNLSFQVLTMQYVKKHCKVKSVVCPKGGAFFFFFFLKCHTNSEGRKRPPTDTVTLFSEPVRNSSLAVSRNSMIGLSCVTHWIRSSLCSSNRTDKVFPSSVLPGGERVRDEQEKLVNLKKMTAWFVKRDLTE